MNKPRFFKSFSLLVILALLAAGLFVFGTQRALAEAQLESNDVIPQLSIHINENAVFGFFWPAGPGATITIDDPLTGSSPDFTAPANWDTNNSWYYLQLGDRYTLKPGDVVTMQDSLYTKSITVVPFAVTDINVTANTVSGQTAPDYYVGVSIAPDWAIRRDMRSDGQGEWTVDFSLPVEQSYDIVPGSVGQAYAVDDDGDTVQVNWRVPNPNIRMWLGNNTQFAAGYDWPASNQVTLTIFSDITPDAAVLFGPADQTADQVGNVGYSISGFQVVPGMRLVMTDGTTTKEHIVLPVTVTEGSFTTDSFAGTAVPNKPLGVCVWNELGCGEATADGNGYWSVDYSNSGVDIKPGTGANADQYDEDGDGTSFMYVIPNPYFAVHVNNDILQSAIWHFHNQVHGLNWPLGSFVTLSLDGNVVDTRKVEVSGWDSNTTFVGFDLSSFTLSPGQVITLSMEGLTKSHTITRLEVTGYDLTSDTVSGTALPGTSIEINACGANVCSNRSVVAGLEGNWTAEFGTAGEGQQTVDIQAGSVIEAMQYDEFGDYTANKFSVPSPQIKAYLSENRIETYGWPAEDNSLDLTITGGAKPYSITLPTTAAPWDGSPGYANLELGSDFILAPLQEIKVSDGIITKTLTVMDLYVDSFDSVTKTVTGHADAGAWVQVGLWVKDWPTANVQADASTGFLTASFKQYPEDLLPWTAGDLTTWDVDGDQTLYRINMGHVYTWPGSDNIVRNGCLVSQIYTLTIDDVSNGEGVDHTDTRQCGANGSPGDVFFPLNGFPLEPGDKIVVASEHGDDPRTLVVTPRGTISFDPDKDIISGKDQPETYLTIWTPHESRYVKTDASGNWRIDYKEPGPNGEPAEDITPGMGGGTSTFDEDGDETGYGWQVPAPQIRALLSENRIEASGWPFGTTVRLTIIGDGVSYSDSQVITTGAPWDSAAGYANFDLGLDFTLAPDQEITVEGGTFTKTLTVMDLYVSSFDPAAKTVTGYADAGAWVQVGVWLDNYWPALFVQADANTGFWQAIFDQSAQPFLPWTGGDVTSWDADGDATFYRINGGNVNVWPGGDIVRDGCTKSRIYTLTIDDPSTVKTIDFEATGRCHPTPDGNNTTVAFQLGTFILDTGDLITVASGHDVRTLVVTPKGDVSFDIEKDIISGKNYPNNYVGVWINGIQSWRTVQARPDGTWSINYHEPGPNGEPAVNIVRGMTGGVVEDNAVGDNTGYGWYMPFLDVHPQYDLVYAVGWNRGDFLTLSIDDLSGNSPADFTAIVGDAPWGDPNATAGDFPLQGFDLLPGQILTVSGAGMTFTYTIPDPKITKFDVIADTASGTGTPGARMQVSPNIPGQWFAREVKVDNAGDWMVSFTPSSNPSDSPSSFDLQPGSPVSFSEKNEYGDQTWGDDWTIPYPTSGSAMGEGVFSSPAGAYTPKQAFAGSASFQFDAKYGRTGRLTGSFQLEFKGFSFQSTTLDWMAIEGGRIQLAGAGKINGKGTYGFMVNAVDGSQPGAGGQDMIRIRIWDLATGEIIYDNEPGLADAVTPTTPVKDGEVTILKKPDQ